MSVLNRSNQILKEFGRLRFLWIVINIMAIEMVMFYDNDTSIRGDETLYSVPPPIKKHRNQ